MGKLVLTSTENSPVDSPKGENKSVGGQKKSIDTRKNSGVLKTFSMQKLKESSHQEEIKSLKITSLANEPMIESNIKNKEIDKVKLGQIQNQDSAMTKSEMMMSSQQLNEESQQ